MATACRYQIAGAGVIIVIKFDFCANKTKNKIFEFTTVR